MEWTQEKGAFYNFSIEPQATYITNTNNTFVQMEVRYNTMYNVNIVAYSYHADRSRASTAVTLKYGKRKFVDYQFWSNECNIYSRTLFFSTAKCDYPITYRIFISGYYPPMIEGSRIMLSCPFRYSLKGSNTSTCMGNGEWEPDPRKAECKGINTTKSNLSWSDDCWYLGSYWYPNFQLVFVNQIHYHDKTKLVCYNIMCVIYVKSSLLE